MMIRLTVSMICVLSWLAPASATPITYSFRSENATQLGPDLYSDGFELRFEGDTDDVANGSGIGNLQGTIILDDGRSATLLDGPTWSIGISREIATYSSAGFFPAGTPTVDLVWQWQSEISLWSTSGGGFRLFAPLLQENGQLIASGQRYTGRSEFDKATDGCELATDFELEGYANITRIPRDFGGQFNQHDGLFVETSLGTLVSFDSITFSSTVSVPEPSSVFFCGALALIGCTRPRRRIRHEQFVR